MCSIQHSRWILRSRITASLSSFIPDENDGLSEKSWNSQDCLNGQSKEEKTVDTSESLLTPLIDADETSCILVNICLNAWIRVNKQLLQAYYKTAFTGIVYIQHSM